MPICIYDHLSTSPLWLRAVQTEGQFCSLQLHCVERGADSHTHRIYFCHAENMIYFVNESSTPARQKRPCSEKSYRVQDKKVTLQETGVPLIAQKNRTSFFSANLCFPHAQVTAVRLTTFALPFALHVAHVTPHSMLLTSPDRIHFSFSSRTSLSYQRLHFPHCFSC